MLSLLPIKSSYDPKYEIATQIMNLLMNSDLRSIIKEEKEDNIASDLGMDDYLNSLFVYATNLGF